MSWENNSINSYDLISVLVQIAEYFLYLVMAINQTVGHTQIVCSSTYCT